MTDLGNDPDGDLDDYDGPTNCTCGAWAQGGRDINCPTHADQNRQVLGYPAGARQCLGCLVDSQPHACGYVAPVAIAPARWRQP